MPYKSERISIAGTIYDRRRKLSDIQKDQIREIREKDGLSYAKLAAMFNVSKRLISFVCYPEKEAAANEQYRIRRSDGRYKRTSEERAAIQRDHRKHKEKLYKEGKI